MAGVALVAAIDAVLCLNGSFGHRRGAAPDPEETVGLNPRMSVNSAKAASSQPLPKLPNNYKNQTHGLLNNCYVSFVQFKG